MRWGFMTGQQVLAARRGAREALAEMAAQNARLVVGYCAKKAELKRLQEGLAAERARWQVGGAGSCADVKARSQIPTLKGSGSANILCGRAQCWRGRLQTPFRGHKPSDGPCKEKNSLHATSQYSATWTPSMASGICRHAL